MATISDLIGTLYPILNLHTSTLVRHASQLHVANLLPGEDEPLTALEAATFLAAVTGARAPTEAIEAARVFASLPFIGVEEGHENPATGAMSGMRLGIGDPVSPPIASCECHRAHHEQSVTPDAGPSHPLAPERPMTEGVQLDTQTSRACQDFQAALSKKLPPKP